MPPQNGSSVQIDPAFTSDHAGRFAVAGSGRKDTLGMRAEARRTSPCDRETTPSASRRPRVPVVIQQLHARSRSFAHSSGTRGTTTVVRVSQRRPGRGQRIAARPIGDAGSIRRPAPPLGGWATPATSTILRQRMPRDMGRKSDGCSGISSAPTWGGRGAFVPPGGRAPSDATVMREPDTLPPTRASGAQMRVDNDRCQGQSANTHRCIARYAPRERPPEARSRGFRDARPPGLTVRLAPLPAHMTREPACREVKDHGP